MFNALMRVRLAGIRAGLFSGANVNKRGKLVKGLLIAAIAYGFVAMLFLFGWLFDTMYEPFNTLGFKWLYFGMAGLICFGLCFFEDVFAVQSALFNAKDNELLLSMPIKPKSILLSRIAQLLVMDYLTQLIVIIPVAVVYFIYATPTFLGIVIFIVSFTLLPFMSLALASVVGYLMALLSAKIPGKNIIKMLFSVGFLVGYIVLMSQLNMYIVKLVANGERIAAAIQKGMFPIYHLGNAIASRDILSLLLLALCCIVPFVIMIAIFSRSFLSMVANKRGRSYAAYKGGELKPRGLRWALTVKELSHFSSSTGYMLNSAIGIVFMVIGAGALFIKQDLLQVFAATFGAVIGAYLPAFGILVACAIASMVYISAPSVSIEGKSLWVMKASPVSAADFLLPKAYAHMVVCLPANLILSLALAVTLKPSAPLTILLFLLPALITVFAALLGVVVNMRFPRFDWANEVIAVKQGMSTMITMFGTFAVVAAAGLLYGFILRKSMSLEVFAALFAAVLLIACGLMYYKLAHRSEANYIEL